MPHCIGPARLARGAQDFGEAFRHHVGPHLRCDRQDNDPNSGSASKTPLDQALLLTNLSRPFLCAREEPPEARGIIARFTAFTRVHARKGCKAQRANGWRFEDVWLDK